MVFFLTLVFYKPFLASLVPFKTRWHTSMRTAEGIWWQTWLRGWRSQRCPQFSTKLPNITGNFWWSNGAFLRWLAVINVFKSLPTLSDSKLLVVNGVFMVMKSNCPKTFFWDLSAISLISYWLNGYEWVRHQGADPILQAFYLRYFILGETEICPS